MIHRGYVLGARQMLTNRQMELCFLKCFSTEYEELAVVYLGPRSTANTIFLDSVSQ